MSEIETIDRDDATETREIDFLVKCNSCSFTQPKSCPSGCPKGHEVGWSYAGPMPEPGTAVFIEPPDEPEPEYFDEDEGIPSEIQAIDEDGPSEEELEADLTSIEVEKALAHMFEIQDRLDAAADDAAEKADVAKTAKKRVESLQEDLSVAVKRVREARTKSEPDPDRYPLLDGPRPEVAAKDAIDASFPRPEAIAPLPADTFEEHARRMGIHTQIEALGLPPKLVEVLADAGVHTIDQWGRKRAAVEEGGASVTTIKGLTEARLEKLVAAIDREMRAWAEAWDESHPGDDATADAEGVDRG